MKTRLIPLLTLFASMSVFAADPAKTDPPEADPPAEFDQYWMVFLIRGDNPPKLDEETNALNMRQHLGHLNWLWEEGYALVAGPFGGEPDDPMRGIVLLRGDLTEVQARELAERDPRVKIGLLKVDIRPWYTDAGALAFPLKPE